MNPMLLQALCYSKEGLNIIPVLCRQKNPAIEWQPYQTRRSTTTEIMQWFGDGGQSYNIGAVHGEVSNGYVLLDIDKDAGLYETLTESFPKLCSGRIIQSGSGRGYHIPLFSSQLPDFGWNAKHQRPVGNRTWRTDTGHLNIRAQFCQSVLPPSVHPNLRPYVFLQEGPITTTPNLDALIAWLNELDPPKEKPARRRNGDYSPPLAGSLQAAALAAWPTTLEIFEHFGLAQNGTRPVNGDETKVSGNGGLIIAADETTWYCFEAEYGGGPVEAWGWCRFGSAYDNRRQFRTVLLEMALAAGVDTARFHRRGDERVSVEGGGQRDYWEQQHIGRWGELR